MILDSYYSRSTELVQDLSERYLNMSDEMSEDLAIVKRDLKDEIDKTRRQILSLLASQN